MQSVETAFYGEGEIVAKRRATAWTECSSIVDGLAEEAEV
jgi:hypothetical protein